MSNIIYWGTLDGSLRGNLVDLVQATTEPVIIACQKLDGTAYDLSAYTVTCKKRNRDDDSVATLTGTITPGNGTLTLTPSSADFGAGGNFLLMFIAVSGGTTNKSYPVRLTVIEDPSTTTVVSDPDVGVSAAEAAWLTAEVAATGAAADGEILQSDGTNSEGSGYLTATSLRKNNYTATSDPTTTDDTNSGYAPGSLWVNVTIDGAFVCLDSTASGAVWLRVPEFASAISADSGYLEDQTLDIVIDTIALRLDAIEEPSENEQTGTSYTLVIGDAGKVIQTTTGSGITVTVPPNSSVAFDTDTIVGLEQYGAGTLTVAAGSGVTIRSFGASLALGGQYAVAALRKIGADEWILFGNLA